MKYYVRRKTCKLKTNYIYHKTYTCFFLNSRPRKTTPNLMLYGELGRFPISVLIKSRMIVFGQRIVKGKQDKISSKLYHILLEMHNRDLFHSKWLLYIKSILNDCGKDYFWLNQDGIPSNISINVKLKLMELHSTSWKHSILIVQNV